MTGAPPFNAGNIAALIAAHSTQAPPSITARRPGLPDSLDAVFARALAKYPDARFQSCLEFVEALREPSASVVPRAAVSAVVREKRPWVTAGRTLKIVAVVMLLALTAFGVGRTLIRNTYYVADYQGAVTIMQGPRDSILGIHLNRPFIQAWLSAHDGLSEVRYSESPNHCRLLRIDDLQPDKRAQLQARTGDGSLELRYLVRAGLLPICNSASPPQTPPAELPSAPAESGIDCRPTV